MSMEEKEISEIIKFINEKYKEEIPRIIKPVIKRKAKKIELLEIDDFPESFKKCTVEELISIIKNAFKEAKLKF